MFETVPDSFWKTSMIDPASSLTWSGDRAANRGWKPSKTAVRSIAGVVRVRGMTPPARQWSSPADSRENGQKTLAQKVLEVDGGQ